MEWITPFEQSFMDKGWEKGLKKGLAQGLRQGLKQGLKQGREEGVKEGVREGVLSVLERQLARRFGPLSKTSRSRLAKASLEQLQAWSEALPEAQSLKEFFSAY